MPITFGWIYLKVILTIALIMVSMLAMTFYKSIRFLLIFCFVSSFPGCSEKNVTGNTPPPVVNQPGLPVDYYLTKGDQSTLLTKQPQVTFGNSSNQSVTITVDTTIQYQSMDGFGYTLTGGSAQLISMLPANDRNTILQELFSSSGSGIGISYLRISIGASDLSASVFTYNDLPAGETDINLDKFTLSQDTIHLIPLLKQIISINPSMKIMGTPWTSPVWMKTNNSSVGGKLKPEYYAVYAKYFVKYIQAMKSHGIPIDAITPQNEPLNAHNNPSLEMLATEQADFIKNHLGPAFISAGITTKIIIYDHNADRPDYPLAILNDAAAKNFVNGSAFHLYGGDINALSTVRNAHPDRNIYFTEQYTASTGNFGGDLAWHIRNLIIGAPRNWSRNVLEWNLANDASFGPHTEGGCTTCKGALTVNGNIITRNVAYYIIAHASKFVPAGSIRVMTNSDSYIRNVAYLRPDGRKVLIVLNDSNATQQFNISFKSNRLTSTLDAGAVATYIW